jgi:hypothetical protein
MDSALAVLAAAVATWFAAELFVAWRTRPRLHAEIWSVAFAAYAIATWALAAGLLLGWSPFVFRVFYFFGAVANIPLLAAGSIALYNEKAGRRSLTVITLWLLFGFFSVFLAPLNSLPGAGIPEGSEVFGFTFMIDALTLPGPRLFAAVSGAVGTLIVVGFAAVSIARFWGKDRRRAVGNIFIVGGALVPALGGSLTAIGESAALSLSLAIGITMLWWGYRLASGGLEREVGRPTHEDQR